MMSDAAAQDRYAAERKQMVEEIARTTRETRGETGRAELSPAVMDAMSRVLRHRLVPAADQHNAYKNRPVAIGHGQTISQPFIVALMTELLEVRNGDWALARSHNDDCRVRATSSKDERGEHAKATRDASPRKSSTTFHSARLARQPCKAKRGPKADRIEAKPRGSVGAASRRAPPPPKRRPEGGRSYSDGGTRGPSVRLRRHSGSNGVASPSAHGARNKLHRTPLPGPCLAPHGTRLFAHPLSPRNSRG